MCVCERERECVCGCGCVRVNRDRVWVCIRFLKSTEETETVIERQKEKNCQQSGKERKRVKKYNRNSERKVDEDKVKTRQRLLNR